MCMTCPDAAVQVGAVSPVKAFLAAQAFVIPPSRADTAVQDALHVPPLAYCTSWPLQCSSSIPRCFGYVLS